MMFKRFTIAAAAVAMGTTAMAPVAADAQRYGDRYAYDRAYDDGYNGRDYRRDGYRDYRRDSYYDGGRRDYRGDRGYYRARNRCNSGTTGTIVGAIAGGLLGRTIDTRGDRATGTILGGAAGALAGRAVGRSNNPGYCR